MGFILDSADYPGHLKDFGGSLLANHLLCDGTSYLVASYPNLFANIGYTFGGSGANFNVPDCRRSVTIGSGGTQISGPGTTVGSTGGEETHTLSTGEIPSHTHGPGSLNFSMANITGSGGHPAAGTNDNSKGPAPVTGGTTDGGSVGGGAHNNMQPSIVVTKQIRY